MAERVGFEPTMELPPCRISSAVPSTTRPPLQAFEDIHKIGLASVVENAVCYRFATECLWPRVSLSPNTVLRQRGKACLPPFALNACPPIACRLHAGVRGGGIGHARGVRGRSSGDRVQDARSFHRGNDPLFVMTQCLAE